MTKNGHSVPGIIASSFACVFLVWIVVGYAYLLGVAGMLGKGHVSELGPHAESARLVAFSIAGSAAVFIIGTIISVAGLADRGAKKLFRYLGVALNVAGLATIVALNVLIRLAQPR